MSQTSPTASEHLPLSYRPDIDGLRAIAVLAVVFFHAFPAWLPGGFAGVDIFFVISGYLISYIVIADAQAGRFRFLGFYVRRIRRIFPVLLIVLVACYAAGWNLLDEGDFGYLGKHIAGGSVFGLNFVLWNEAGYFDPSASTKPLLHLWSLAVEEQFYLVWPAFLLVALRLRWNRMAAITAVALGSFVCNLWLIKTGSAGAYYSPLSRFWELLVGAIGACLMHDHASLVQSWRKRLGHAMSWIGFALVLGSAFLLRQDLPFPGWWAMPAVFGALAVILAGPDAWLNRFALSNRAMVSIGLISYPLYLWHWPILVFWNLTRTAAPTMLEKLGMVLLAVVLSWLVYRLIERPVRRHTADKTAIALVVLLLGVGFAGYNCYVRGGLPYRSVVKAELNHSIGDYLGTPATAINCSVIDGNVPAKACLDPGADAAKPLVFLWGDSHTANVSYGFTSDRLERLGIRLAVAMHGGCPPVIGYQPKPATPATCRDFDEKSLAKIRALKPDVVMLTGSWSLYREDEHYSRLDVDALIATVAQIKRMGVKKVIIVGCFPVFEISQAKLSQRLFVPGKQDRTFERFDTSLYGLDALIRKTAAKAGADFISPLDYLCDKSGCLISASKTKFEPMAYDLSHMTYPGSNYFDDRAISKATFSQ